MTTTMVRDYTEAADLQQLEIRFRAECNRLKICSCQILDAAIICLVHMSDRAGPQKAVAQLQLCVLVCEAVVVRDYTQVVCVCGQAAMHMNL